MGPMMSNHMMGKTTPGYRMTMHISDNISITLVLGSYGI